MRGAKGPGNYASYGTAEARKPGIQGPRPATDSGDGMMLTCRQAAREDKQTAIA